MASIRIITKRKLFWFKLGCLFLTLARLCLSRALWLKVGEQPWECAIGSLQITIKDKFGKEV